MNRTFIEIPLFSERWKELGFSENDLMELQIQLLDKPDAGAIMTGTGGSRKQLWVYQRRPSKPGKAVAPIRQVLPAD